MIVADGGDEYQFRCLNPLFYLLVLEFMAEPCNLSRYSVFRRGRGNRRAGQFR